MMYRKTYRTKFLVIIFVLIIAFPFLNSRFVFVKDIPSSENRQMSKEPVFDVKKLDPFPTAYEKFYNDTFELRSLLVQWNNKINIRYFHKSPFPDIAIIGKDDWMFNGEKELEASRGDSAFTEKQLEDLRLELEYRQDYLKKAGCTFYLMIAPCKATIYPEKLPRQYYRENSISLGTQVVDYLKRKSSVNVVDLFEPLKKAKADRQIYRKLDTHWNEIGSFLSVNEFLKKAKQNFPTIEVPRLEDMKIEAGIKKDGNITQMMGDTAYFEDSTYAVTPLRGYKAKDSQRVGYPCVEGFPYCWEYETVRLQDDTTKPRLLLISDSFGAAFFPMVAEGFQRSEKIFDAWQYKLNEEIVGHEKPDVFLLLILEQNLKTMMKYPSLKR